MKIAIVVQRYGLNINGGAEALCRLITERLSKKYEIEVLTTKAVDYISWEDDYLCDKEIINGAMVRRFGVKYPRKMEFFEYLTNKVKCEKYGDSVEEKWLNTQGPYAPNLIEYLDKHIDEYQVIICFTYLYYPSIATINKFGEKCILVPFAHDEWTLKLNIMKKVFTKPKAIVYSTEEEKKLVQGLFNNENIRHELAGAGIDVPMNLKKSFSYENYIIYVGRIDYSKKCDGLIKYFIKYKKSHNNDLKLVLVGKCVMEIPERDDIILTGFVSEEEKFSLIKYAKVLINPSQFESLSLVILEAFSLGVPALVNGKCEVLKAHCIKSNAALYFTNYSEFVKALDYLLEHENIAKNMGKNGIKYVNENYTWEKVINNFDKLIKYVIN